MTFVSVLMFGALSLVAPSGLAFAAEGTSIPLEFKAQYEQGVQAYRTGQYVEASRIFSALHAVKPEISKFTYYWAISEARQEHIEQARRLYEEILTLDPNGVASDYAKKGLSYLPDSASNGLDVPPNFQKSTHSGKEASATSADSASVNTQMPSLPAGVTMQDWMALQMMMGQSNSLGGNPMGGNAMAGIMMPGLTPGQSGSNAGVDPSLFSNMLMNQMLMQSLPGGSDSNENH